MRVIVMALVGLALAVGPGSTVGAGDDEAAIRGISDKYIAAWNKADAKAVAALYTTDASWTDVSGTTTRGRDAIEKLCLEWLAGAYKGTRLEIGTEAIRFLKPDVAVWDGSFKISTTKGPEGEAPAVKGVYSSTLVKKDGEWVMAAHHTMVPPPPPPPPPPAEK